MEHHEMDVSRWVDGRLSALDPGNWRPDSSAALARLRHRDTSRRRRWWLWATVSAAALAGCAGLLLVSTPSACANPLGCSQPVRRAPVFLPAVAVAPKTAAPNPVVAAPAHRVAPARKANFKESGSPTAPITCELYTDYQCPFCATFYLETVPRLVASYVDSGKVRLIHRDFPLAQHRYARLAARYADAAGEAGYYQAAATRIFRTQAVWSGDGDVDGQVAQVVPPAAMEGVRARVRNDPAAEQSVASDEALARANRIDRTPTLVCNRHVFTGHVSFSEIQEYLDPLLAPQ
jgi:protein-disulfide isomerase